MNERKSSSDCGSRAGGEAIVRKRCCCLDALLKHCLKVVEVSNWGHCQDILRLQRWDGDSSHKVDAGKDVVPGVLISLNLGCEDRGRGGMIEGGL